MPIISVVIFPWRTLFSVSPSRPVLVAQVETIRQHPAITLTPADHRQAMAQAGRGLVSEAAGHLGRATEAVAQERQALGDLVGAMRAQHEHQKHLLWAGAVACLVGLLFSPVIASVLPFGLNGYIAAAIMRSSRDEAGATLMAAGNPEGWRATASAIDLLIPNKTALAACREAAARTKKEQRCTLVVPAPRS